MRQWAPNRRQYLLLAGPPGVGKSTLGSRVARELKWKFLDLDMLVENQQGLSPARIIEEHGETSFRHMERDALLQVEQQEYPAPTVLALGGGTLQSPDSRAVARRLGPIVGLSAAPEQILERLAQQHSGTPKRPLLPQPQDFKDFLVARGPNYQAVDHQLSTEGPLQEQFAVLKQLQMRTQVVLANFEKHQTRIVVGQGLQHAVRGALRHLAPQRPVLLIEDQGIPQTVRDDYVGALQSESLIRVPVCGGEPVKDWTLLGRVLEQALASNCGRQSVVLAIGGGATCDMAGMAAHLLGRGARSILVPSTLLSQVDASVGGKCAVNMAGGRNLIGAFHPPSEVITDLDLLATLSPEEYRSGLAEALKMAVICDGALFDELVTKPRLTTSQLARLITHKACIVAQDPRETGIRKHLNLGHTLGHALESASNFQLRHGEAVAIGMAAVARWSHAQGMLPEATMVKLLKGLTACGLPIGAPPELLEASRSHFKADKKGVQGYIDIIAVESLGKVTVKRLSLEEAQDGLIGFGGCS